MSAQQRQEASQRIVDRLLPQLKDARCIGIYMAQGSEANVDALCQLLAHKTLAAPVCAQAGIMHFHALGKSFVVSAMGIREPKGERIVPQMLDVILVPLVAFDAQCHRLGHGAGYYDRYLPQSHALRIGVSFECQKVHQIQAMPHDVDMDLIVTERQLYFR